MSDMRTLLKVFVALALVLPLGGFVAGSLAASSADDPAPQDTIIIQRSDPSSGPGTHEPSRSPRHDASTEPGDDDGDDDVRVASPDPGEVDDVGDDHGEDVGEDVGDDHGGARGDDGVDNSGPGSVSSGSDDSGSGGSGGGGDDDHRSGSGHDDSPGSDG